MKYTFMEEHRSEFPVQRLCEVLEVSTSGYYAWSQREPGPRQQENEQLLEVMQSIHQESRQTYGSPRMLAELRDRGWTVNHKRVERLMRLHNLQAKIRSRQRVRTTLSQHDFPVVANQLDQDFTADAPNRKWLADITYIETAEGFLYLASILDVFSRKIVGWSMTDHLRTDLPLQALSMALEQRQPPRHLLHHSDQGSQYASDAYQQALATAGIQASMSHVGNCYDNAMKESFFGTLKTELVYHHQYQTRDQARLSIFEYIEVFYNRQRRHSALGYLSPDNFERLHGF